MEKEVVTTQSLDSKTIKNAVKVISLSLKGKWMIYIVVLIIFTLANFLTAPEDNNNHYESGTPETDSVTWSEVFVTLLPVIVFVGIFIFMRYLVKRNTTQQIQKKSRYFTNVTYTINNSFFKKQGEGFENTYYWNEIYRVKETPKFYLIFSEKNQAHVIDKAQLDPWQLEEIKEIFNSLRSKVKVSLK